ncbi:MAG: hypothetical protein H0X03_09625 [Nitrosopumilus sp.]|nr:hypothetical protein [Nitrosopumilus sp.]
MNLYPVLIIILTIYIFSSFVPNVFSIENLNASSLSSYEKKCNTDSCIVTTCYDNQPCVTTGINNKTSTSDEINPIFTNSNSESKNLDIVKLVKSFLNFK